MLGVFSGRMATASRLMSSAASRAESSAAPLAVTRGRASGVSLLCARVSKLERPLASGLAAQELRVLTGSTPSVVQSRALSTFGKDRYEPSPEEKRGTEAKAAEEKKGKGISGMIKEYGPIAIVVYLGVYVVTLFSIFVLVQSGIGLEAKDIIHRIEGLSFISQDMKDRVNNMVKDASPTVINFAAAWLATKVTEPLRFMATVALVPTVARSWNAHKAAQAAAGGASKALALPLVVVALSQMDKGDESHSGSSSNSSYGAAPSKSGGRGDWF